MKRRIKKMKYFLNNKKKIALLMGVLLIVIFAQAIFIAQLISNKDHKNYEVNLVKINNQKDSIDYLKMSTDLNKLDGTIRNISSFLTSKKIYSEKIEKLNKDSLSSAVYLAKQSNRYSQYLVDLEKKLRQVPLGIPSDGYISSSFGKRKNPIPNKTAQIVLASVASTPAVKTITRTEVINTEPRIVQLRDDQGNVTREITVMPKPKTITITETVPVEKPAAGTKTKEINNAPAEPDQMQFHKGIDIAAAYGRDVRCAAEGTVIFAGVKGGYGNCIIVSHGNGLATLYAHLSKIEVKANDKVEVNQVIAKSGNSGRSTGPHLHYEIHKNNQPVNPKLFMSL